MKITVLQDASGFVVDAVLKQNGVPIDLTTATAVTFRARAIGGVGKRVTRACSVLNAVAGSVRLTLAAADTALVANYRGIFEITWPAGEPTTVPNTAFINYQVIAGV